jgi:hypothetical protein
VRVNKFGQYTGRAYVMLRRVTPNTGRDYQQFEEATNGSRLTKTQESIWKFVTNVPEQFDVVIADNASTCPAYTLFLEEAREGGPGFDPQALEAIQQVTGSRTIEVPTVVWAPSRPYTVYADAKGVRRDGSGKVLGLDLMNPPYAEPWERMRASEKRWIKNKPLLTKGGRSYGRIVVVVTKYDMPANLVLFHELGHVKQYFTSDYARGLMGKSSFVSKMTGRDSDIFAYEADNLRRHEHPMCREMLLPLRAHYKDDLSGWFNHVPQFDLQRCIWKECTPQNRQTEEAKVKRDYAVT